MRGGVGTLEFMDRSWFGQKRHRSVKRKRSRRYGLAEMLEPRLVMDGSLIISELMAVNNSTVRDLDGEYSDWLEIHNPTASPVNLENWYLTDDPNNLQQWSFPSLTIPADEYLLVFASGKDLKGGQLHTNFRLGSSGEYLALVRSDGVTIVDEYAPGYPRQLADISYGITESVNVTQELVGEGATVRALTPGDDSLGSVWTGSPVNEPFNDSTWIGGDSSVGFEAEVPTTFNARINFQPLDAEQPNDFDIDAGAVFGARPGGLTYGWDQAVNTVERNPDPQGVEELVAWWKFDEASGTIAADSAPAGIQHSAALMGSDAGFVADGGRFGGAVRLAGVDEFILADDHSDFEFAANQSFSVALWYKNDGAEATNNGLITKGYNTPLRNENGYWMLQAAGSAGEVELDSRQGAGSNPRVRVKKAGINVGNGQWNHIVLVRDSEADEIRVYLNNQAPEILTGIDAGNGDWAMGANDSPLVIGNHFDRFTPGWFDDVGIWKGKALSAEEITTIFEGGIEALNIVDQRSDTFAEMQDGGDRTWELEVPNGIYDVEVSFGDVDTASQINNVELEGVVLTDPDGADNFDVFNATVTVGDGRLKVRPAAGASGVKFNYVVIEPAPRISYDGFFELDLESEMAGSSTSAYLRFPFDVADASEFQTLNLGMRYDDGFVAYLNGVEIARRNAPANPTFNSAATAQRDDALAIASEQIDVTQFLPRLRNGPNVLAIQALNAAIDDQDFLLAPELYGNAVLSGQAQYYTTPTPRQKNQPGALGLVADTKFSVDRGFYDAPFQVEISSDTNNVEIRYTLDGTRPTATTGEIYQGPIDVATTTTLRAAAFRPGYLSSNVDTHTYVFAEDVLQQSGSGLTSVNWGHAGPDWAVDPDIVNHNDPESRLVADDLKAIPTVSLVLDWEEVFGSSGIYISGQGVEIATSFELFDAQGQDDTQIDASVQIVGGSSTGRWKSDKLSMRVKFTEAFGPTDLQYPVFGPDNAQVFDTLVLDARLNNVWSYGGGSDPDGQRTHAQYTRDQFTADLHNELGGYSPHGRHVHVYINGVYWGMHTMHERPDDNFAAQYLGGDNEDYDVVKHTSSTVVSGSNASYLQLLNAVDRDMANSANYRAVENMLDIDDFINYMLVNYYVGNTDWALHNWYASYNRVDPEGRWRFHSWDAEKGLQDLGDNLTARDEAGSPTHIQQRLMGNLEYRTRFADRVQEHFFNEGLLTPSRAESMYQLRLDEIDRAVVAESARWGDNQRAAPFTRGNEWIAERDRLLDTYFPARSNVVLNQFRSRGWFPSASVSAPSFRINSDTMYGGQISPGDTLTMFAGAGTIYYTDDGGDPREEGGSISSEAKVYSGEIDLFETARINARLRASSGQWSPLSKAWFFVNSAPRAETLKITEINYHPTAPTAAELAVDPTWTAGDFEFVELQNQGDATLDLVGVRFSRGIQFEFTGQERLTLAAGDYLVVASNRQAFETRYDASVAVAGEFVSGALDDAGERLTLLDRNLGTLVDFSYNDSGSWPGRADGNGSSLEIVDASADYARSSNWRSSSEYNGSPGQAGAGPIQNSVVVNEVLTHTDLPQLDTIELYNSSAEAIDLSGWFLSDNSANYRKFEIPPNTILPAGEYLLFDEDDFNPGGGLGENDFSLDGAHGDDVWLLQTNAAGELAAFVDHVDFGAAANGESWGRWPNGSGALTPMAELTLGAENGSPRVGPLVISEVMYHADNGLEPDASDLEFVEIFNPTATIVDLTQWRLRGGVDFDFAAATMLGPQESLVVITFNPSKAENADRLTIFRGFYGLDESVRLVGGFDGRLDNAGDTVRLLRPDEPPLEEPDFVPLLLEDQIAYDSLAPWPISADAGGDSLTRVFPYELGSQASSWFAAPPTPGSVSTLPSVVAVVINGHNQDPPHLPAGSQPSQWRNQRSDLRSLVVQFNMEVQATASDVRLINLGLNAPVDDDTTITLGEQHFQLDGNVLTLTFARNELPQGVYQLELLPTITGVDGALLDGDGDGSEGGVFVFAGNAENRFHKLAGDFNGDQGTTIFDFPTFAYWFGQSTPTAPDYADLNVDGGVTIFDFPLFAAAFGHSVVYPVALRQGALLAPPASESSARRNSQLDLPAEQQVGERAGAAWFGTAQPAQRVVVEERGQRRDRVDSLSLEQVLEEIAADVLQHWR